MFILIACNIFAYAYLNAIPYVKSDGWRFISIYLMPWYENALTITDLFKDHHPAPLIASLFILNAEIFNLRMDYEAILGVIFIILSAYLLVNEVRKFSKSIWVQVSIVLVSMSLVSTNLYTWSLVTIGYIAGFCGLLIVVYVDRTRMSAFQNLNHLFVFIYSGLFLVVFGDFAKIVLISTAICYSACIIFNKKKEDLYIVIVIGLSLILTKSFYFAINAGGHYSAQNVGNRLFNNFDNIVEIVNYIGVGLLSAFCNLVAFKKILHVDNGAVELIGFVVLIVYAVAITLYYKYKMYDRTKMPVILILISILTAVAAAVYRFNPELQDPISANIPRYYRSYSYGLIGAIWIFSYFTKTNVKALKLCGYMFFSCIIVAQAVSTAYAWKISKYIRKDIVSVCEIMRAHGDGDYSKKVPRYVTGNNFPKKYKKGIEFLKSNQMSVFSDNFSLDKYK